MRGAHWFFEEDSMADVILPLIAGLGPELINLVVGLIHQKAPAAEAMGPSTGPVKFADVFVAVMSDLTKAKAAGQIAVLPDDAVVKLIIQAVVMSMKLSGVLEGAKDPGSGPQRITLSAGQSLVESA